MAGTKKKTAPAKKRAATTLASKSPKKKTGTKTPAKGKTLRGSKSAKPAPKPVKKTAVSRKPAAKKVVARKKTPAKAKVAAKTKPKKVSKTPESSDTLKDIKRALITRRESIVKEAKEEIAKYISGENRQLVDTALDDGDWAVVDISEDINLRRLATHRKALHDIDEALRKIEEGSYGICEECGEAIGEKRLSVLPAATLCVVCQGNKERLEAVENSGPSV
jgi:DnaK suppressor protein